MREWIPVMCGCVWLLVGCGTVLSAEERSPVVARVNGHPVTQREVDLELLTSIGSRPPTPSDQAAARERVIDRRLVNETLGTSTTDVLAEDVENLLQATRTAVESGEDTLGAVLGRLKLSEDDLRTAFRMQLAWHAHVRRSLSESQLRAHFELHRSRFDGTQVRVRQIVRTLTPDADKALWTTAESQLANIRKQLLSGELKFESAAREFSQSPTAANGGDVGFVKPRGQLPSAVCEAAFQLKVGELSPPIRSTVGVHLIEVTETRAGELSLEDARPDLVRELGDKLWVSTVRTLRAKAKIVGP